MAKTFSAEEADLKKRLAELNAHRREREVIEAIDNGAVAQGVRLVAKDAEEGVTFVLSPEEATQLSSVLKQIAQGRIASQENK